MKEKGKTNNQGFSLVELVIVIAIMAILVGIVGTQVIPYIDKARKAKDIQIVNGYCTDATTAFVSCTDQLDVSKSYTITMEKVSTGWTIEVKDSDGTDSTLLKNAFVELNGLDTDYPKFESKEGRKINKIKIECKHGSFATKLTVEGPTDPGAFMVETK